MKRVFYTLGCLAAYLAITFGQPPGVFAQGGQNGRFGQFEVLQELFEGNDDIEAQAEDGLLGFINIAVRITIGIVVVVGVITIVVAGYLYMTAGGNAEQVKSAKSLITGALLGIILALASVLLLNTINPQLGKKAQDPDFGQLP